MSVLEDLMSGSILRLMIPDAIVTSLSVRWFGSQAIELPFRDPAGKVARHIVFGENSETREFIERGRAWSFGGG
jgi:hypothetical protein